MKRNATRTRFGRSLLARPDFNSVACLALLALAAGCRAPLSGGSQRVAPPDYAAAAARQAAAGDEVNATVLAASPSAAGAHHASHMGDAYHMGPTTHAGDVAGNGGAMTAASPTASAAPEGAVLQAGHWGAAAMAGPYASHGYPHAVPAFPSAGHAAACCPGHGGGAPDWHAPTCPPWQTSGATAAGAGAAPTTFFGIDAREFLCDGGDHPPQVRVRHDGSLAGLDLEDTVVHYQTHDGMIHVQPSNRVCLYAPRFAAVRKVTGAIEGERAVAVQGYALPLGPGHLDRRQPSSAVMYPLGPEKNVASRGPDGFRSRDRGVPIEAVDQPLHAGEVVTPLADLALVIRGELRDAEKPWLAKGAEAAIAWSLQDAVQVVIKGQSAAIAAQDLRAEGLTVYDLPDGGRLRICKLADRQNALPGDVVSFALRVDNVGDSAVSEVVITDNLTTRLEYVEGSQTATKGTEFETTENEGGSLQLTWRLTETLAVGEGVIIRFRCLVR